MGNRKKPWQLSHSSASLIILGAKTIAPALLKPAPLLQTGQPGAILFLCANCFSQNSMATCKIKEPASGGLTPFSLSTLFRRPRSCLNPAKTARVFPYPDQLQNGGPVSP